MLNIFACVDWSYLIFLYEVSIQILCQYFNWAVCFLIDMYYKYFLPEWGLSFHFLRDVFHPFFFTYGEIFAYQKILSYVSPRSFIGVAFTLGLQFISI